MDGFNEYWQTKNTSRREKKRENICKLNTQTKEDTGEICKKK